MLVKVDWISFTLDLGLATTKARNALHMPEEIMNVLDFVHPMMGEWLHISDENAACPSRAPYSLAWRWTTRGMTIFCHPNLQHVLFEISGRGCDLLFVEQTLNPLLERIMNNLTRLDIAVDILTETRPSAFVALRDEGRFKTHSEFTSASGDTCYIGSMSSGRYARVYRYNAPHERSRLLRVETVTRNVNARLCAQSVLDLGLQRTANSLGQVFGWAHADWQPQGNNVAVMKAYRPERHIGKTEFWLAKQVVPSLLRLHRDGTLDVMEWFEHYILQELNRE